MDAISFVLGVQSKQLRGNTLADLMYSGTDRDDRAKAFVKLVFRPDPQVHVSTTPAVCGPGVLPCGGVRASGRFQQGPAGCFHYVTQGKWEGCQDLTVLLTTLVLPTREVLLAPELCSLG
jgi:hypothetical protein